MDYPYGEYTFYVATQRLGSEIEDTIDLRNYFTESEWNNLDPVHRKCELDWILRQEFLPNHAEFGYYVRSLHEVA